MAKSGVDYITAPRRLGCLNTTIGEAPLHLIQPAQCPKAHLDLLSFTNTESDDGGSSSLKCNRLVQYH